MRNLDKRLYHICRESLPMVAGHTYSIDGKTLDPPADYSEDMNVEDAWAPQRERVLAAIKAACREVHFQEHKSKLIVQVAGHLVDK